MTTFQVVKKGLAEDWHLVWDSGSPSEIWGHHSSSRRKSQCPGLGGNTLGMWGAEMLGALKHTHRRGPGVGGPGRGDFVTGGMVRSLHLTLATLGGCGRDFIRGVMWSDLFFRRTMVAAVWWVARCLIVLQCQALCFLHLVTYGDPR